MKFTWSGCIYAIAITFVIGLGIYTLSGSQGIPALMQKKAEIKELEKGNADLAKEIEQKRVKIKNLQDDPEAQELEIRRQLKLVHPGEKVFNSQDQDKKPGGK
jgi:cell division protein FtsB